MQQWIPERMHCPACKQPVTIAGGEEGTLHYEPEPEPELERRATAGKTACPVCGGGHWQQEEKDGR